MLRINLEKGVKISLRVTPKSSKDKIEWNLKENRFDVWVTSIPENGKVNDAVEKLFKKEFKVRIKIVSGLTGRVKIGEVI